MSYIDAFILGLVQGLTEFLPISSSGHLVIAQKLLGIENHDLAFDLAAHIGTVLAIFTIYRVLSKKLICELARPQNIFSGATNEGYLIRIVVIGSIPTAVIGLGFKDQFESMFNDMTSLGVCFIITGFLLALSKLRGGARIDAKQILSIDGIRQITWWHALLIGTAQGLAIMPSISRSGSTIITALLLGIAGPTAALYSFIMSVPAILGAAILELKDVAWDSSRIGILLFGLAVAYLSGVAGLWATIQSVRKGRLEIFTVYLVLVGAWVLWAWT